MLGPTTSTSFRRRSSEHWGSPLEMMSHRHHPFLRRPRIHRDSPLRSIRHCLSLLLCRRRRLPATRRFPDTLSRDNSSRLFRALDCPRGHHPSLLRRYLESSTLVNPSHCQPATHHSSWLLSLPMDGKAKVAFCMDSTATTRLR